MGKLLSSLLFLAVAAGMVLATVIFDVELEGHLEHLASQRYPSERHNQGRLDARKYIKDMFRYNGLTIHEQKFNTSIYTDLNTIQEVEGVNIIGIAEAVSDRKGAVIVIGADYDTNGIDDPIFNNGAGVSAMLEVSKLFSFNTEWTNMFYRNYTTVFVAFDLNTREHGVGPGKPGGWYFVNEWLWPFLNKSDVNYGGAIILDSIMNVNYEPNTQTTGPEFQQLWPSVYDRIQSREEKGDFLGVISMGTDKEITLKDQFLGSYNKDRKMKPYCAEDMTLKHPTQLNNLMVELTKPSSFHFWAFKYNNESKPLPAVLLTDTQKIRTRPPPPDECGSRCPPKAMLTDAREEFMESTVMATTRFLMNRQGTYKPMPESGAWTSLPSILTMVLTLLFIRLF